MSVNRGVESNDRNVGKNGFPVLAYSPSESESPWLCSLLFKSSSTRKQATLLLKSSIPVHGFAGEQTFVFQYDADNLVSGTIALGPAAINLPQTRLDNIGRRDVRQMKTLSFRLQSSCPVWCPHFSGSIAPNLDSTSSFHQLVKLASATEVHILFDYNWLHKNVRPSFQCLLDQNLRLTGFPVAEYYAKHYKLADWTAFAPLENAEAPPSYADASKKRPRRGKPSTSI